MNQNDDAGLTGSGRRLAEIEGKLQRGEDVSRDDALFLATELRGAQNQNAGAARDPRGTVPPVTELKSGGNINPSTPAAPAPDSVVRSDMRPLGGKT